MTADKEARDVSLPIFTFEDVGVDLELLPLAARRALDLAGLRLSLKGWRSLDLEDRKSLTRAGASDAVDVGAVAEIAARSSPLAEPMEPSPDPEPGSLPRGIPSIILPLAQWSALRPLDRYALAHACTSAIKKGDPGVFEAAFNAVIGPSRLGGLSPSPSSVSPTLPEYALTQEALPAPAAPPTEPQGWSAPTGGGVEESQPGLTFATVGPPVSDANVSSDGPFRARTTLHSNTEPARVDEVTPLSTHLDASGAARMVDISEKSETMRRAVASGSVRMLPETATRILRSDAPKGEVIGVARVAGIMAAKRTPELIPLCHSIALTHVGIDIQVRVEGEIAEARVTATAEALDRTGVEMEAMVAVSVACLTIYDMLKGIDRAMTITEIKLLEKSGGRSGHFRRGDTQA